VRTQLHKKNSALLPSLTISRIISEKNVPIWNIFLRNKSYWYFKLGKRALLYLLMFQKRFTMRCFKYLKILWVFCSSRNRKNCFLFAHFYSQWDIIKWPWKIYLSVSKSWNLINKWIHFSLSKKMYSAWNDFKMFISPHNGFSFLAYHRYDRHLGRSTDISQWSLSLRRIIVVKYKFACRFQLLH
jgi:hypothetical protein